MDAPRPAGTDGPCGASDPRDRQVVSAGTGEATTRGGRILWWALGVIGTVIAGVTVTLVVNWISEPNGPSPTAVITDPATGAYVDQSTRVAGTSAGIEDFERVMLAVYWPEGRRYYPAVEPLDLDANGDWTGQASVGGPGDSGAEFDLVLVLNDQAAQDELEGYLERVVASGSAPGLDELPTGSQRLDTVSVTRR